MPVFPEDMWGDGLSVLYDDGAWGYGIIGVDQIACQGFAGRLLELREQSAVTYEARCTCGTIMLLFMKGQWVGRVQA